MKDEIVLCRTWLRYFGRASKHFAPRSVDDYTKRVSTWSGEPIRIEAFKTAASQLNYEILGDRIKGSFS